MPPVLPLYHFEHRMARNNMGAVISNIHKEKIHAKKRNFKGVNCDGIKGKTVLRSLINMIININRYFDN